MEIAPGIFRIEEIQGIFVHAFLLDDGDGLTLIDTLQSKGGKRILDQITRMGRSPRDLKHIVLTHAHTAHLGGLAALKEASGASVSCHEWEADIVSGDRDVQCTTLLPQRPFAIWPFQIAARFARHRPCVVDQTLREGDRVGPLEVVHTPGHTPGHLAFYWPERRALFAGDALVNWPEFAPGWPCFMLNEKQNNASLGRMAEIDAEIIAVGHGAPITEGGSGRLKRLVESLK